MLSNDVALTWHFNRSKPCWIKRLEGIVEALFPLAFQPALQSTPIQLVIPSHFRALHLDSLCFGAHFPTQRCIACHSALSMSVLPIVLMREASVQREVIRTHSRKKNLLPFTVRLTIYDEEYEGQYCGHGIDKVAYRITGWSHVLKVTKSQDQEPTVFQTLQKHSLCTEVYDVFNVWYIWHQHDRPGKSKARKIQEELYGWIVQYAESVDRLLVSSEMAYESCICSCLLNIISVLRMVSL